MIYAWSDKCILDWEALTVLVLIEYLNLWEILEEVHLNPKVMDQHSTQVDIYIDKHGKSEY